ncbi:MAG TPA: exopolysaccharide biosynthesis protein [Arenimonas sp.]|uniref:exopolysaccharide biosynthesis protein n=1 Tax=Arenimonas sp. TaxID=1872635 RepID=UPI002BADCF99|nr:exopolysaccharide biosynthesis protein [Arenimonas sp.]HMB55579.1 exopolysaccharide biosynthesis protein [Arenimonas sp.]
MTDVHAASTSTSTRALIDKLADGDPDEALSFSELLDQFSERGFGLFLLLVMLPCFIPLPVGVGGVSGSLVTLIGLQFLWRLEHPWLPGWLGRRRIHRRVLIGFRNRMGKWLDRLEKLTRPRNEAVLTHPLAHAFTGLLLLLLGVLLALPLPLTNYPFGLILLVFAFALIERDGRLMLIAWALGLAEIAVLATFSGAMTKALADVIGWFQH